MERPSAIQIAEALESVARATQGKRPMLRVPSKEEDACREDVGFWREVAYGHARAINDLEGSLADREVTLGTWQLAFFGALVVIAALAAAIFISLKGRV